MGDNKSEDEIWADFCEEFRKAQKNITVVMSKAFVKGWLQEEYVEELHDAHNAADEIRKKMDKFVQNYLKSR
ncbi:MAG: hypothetical protein WCA19_24775 [Candidatus Acidiferrales bacterium]